MAFKHHVLAKPATKASAAPVAAKPSLSLKARPFAPRHDDGHDTESSATSMGKAIQARLMDMPVYSSESGASLRRSPATHEKALEDESPVQRAPQTEEKKLPLPTNNYGVKLVPPLRDPSQSIAPPLNLELPESYRTVPSQPALPDWFWQGPPPMPVQASLMKVLSRWLTEKLGRRELAHIGGYLADKLNIDQEKTIKLLDGALVDAGEVGLKELLKTILEAVAGSVNKRKGADPTSMDYPGFQTPSPELPKPFIFNTPAIKF